MNRIISTIAILASAIAIGNLPVAETTEATKTLGVHPSLPAPADPALHSPGLLNHVPVSIETYPAPAVPPAAKPLAVTPHQAAGFQATCGPNGCGPAGRGFVRRGIFGRRR